MKRKTGDEVQVNNNYRQRGYRKVWDMVLIDYGKVVQ
jgi:hypothetical protein